MDNGEGEVVRGGSIVTVGCEYNGGGEGGREVNAASGVKTLLGVSDAPSQPGGAKGRRGGGGW